MIVFPNCKINLGLQVLNRRSDNYHEIETVFYPIKIYDTLEVIEAKEMSFSPSGSIIDDNPQDNICLKAYHLLANDFRLPLIEVYLHKNIPVGAGLGGGSSDAAFMIKTLNEKFELNLDNKRMELYAQQLGADCAFFIQNDPVFAEGIGNVFSSIELDLSGFYLIIVNPKIHISTAEAYQSVVPDKEGKYLRHHINQPIENWKNNVINDFEVGIFKKYAEIREVKEELYLKGAVYASMSGSGSAVFGIFREKPDLFENLKKYQIVYG